MTDDALTSAEAANVTDDALTSAEAASVTDGMARRLRVALVLGSSTGGIGAHVRSLVLGLIPRGFEVTVCCAPATAELFDYVGAGARVEPLSLPAGLDLRDLRAMRTLRRFLLPDPVDVIHAHGLRAGLAAGLARPSRVPLVVTWHNAVLGRGLRVRALRAAETYVARTADVTLGASDDLVDRARALGGRDVRLGVVAAPSRSAPSRTPAEVRAELEAQGRPIVLSVGRLHPQKGYPGLIAAAARWRSLSPPPLVVIAGTGPAYRELAAQIATERAPAMLLGHRADVPDLLSAADVAVSSSVWEARQLFAQEALAAGVPLVATRVGGLPGLVGDAALLVPPQDVDALDEAVRRLLDDAHLRATLATAGRARAATWPTEQDTLDQVAAVYAELGPATAVASDPVATDPRATDPRATDPRAAEPPDDLDRAP